MNEEILLIFSAIIAIIGGFLVEWEMPQLTRTVPVGLMIVMKAMLLSGVVIGMKLKEHEGVHD